MRRRCTTWRLTSATAATTATATKPTHTTQLHTTPEGEWPVMPTVCYKQLAALSIIRDSVIYGGLWSVAVCDDFVNWRRHCTRC
jgi:hypothetical protein